MEAIDYIVIALKIIVGVSILNVWLIQPTKPTKWRGGNATTIIEEFEVYGLSKTICYIIGFLKVSLALLLLASIWFGSLTAYASSGLALLLFGSIIMHIRIKDPLYKSFPAFILILMTIAISILGS
jgi:hypothetical protein